MLDSGIASRTEDSVNVRPSTIRLIANTATAVLVIAAVSACGDPKGQSPPITLGFSSIYPIPSSLTTGSTTGVEVIVTNDNQNAGANFTCTPDTPIGECGSFSPPSAGSNVPTCYQAPAAVPAGDGTVTLTATSVTDPTKSISSTPIAIVSGISVVTCTP
jgi:hypothetical protein